MSIVKEYLRKEPVVMSKMNDKDDAMKTIGLDPELFNFIRLSDKEKDIFLSKLSDEDKANFLVRLCSVFEPIIDNLKHVMTKEYELVKKYREQVNQYHCKKMLETVNNFDPSDIRLKHECDLDGFDRIVNGEWCEDHIEIFTRKWAYFPYANTREYIEFVLNHEYIHHTINKIMLEDGVYFNEHHGHWPFFAGGIDEIHGVSTSNFQRQLFENPETVPDTMKLLAHCSQIRIDITKWDFV